MFLIFEGSPRAGGKSCLARAIRGNSVIPFIIKIQATGGKIMPGQDEVIINHGVYGGIPYEVMLNIADLGGIRVPKKDNSVEFTSNVRWF